MTLLTAAIPSLCMAAGLVPEQCCLGHNEFRGILDRPLQTIGFSFDGRIEAVSDARAFVTFEGSEVAASVSFEVRNHEGEKRTQGWVYFKFSGECLPKGKEYTLHVAPGSIMLSKDNTVTNDELLIDFRIPEDIGEATFFPESGSVLTGENTISCSLGHETIQVGQPEWELYREGELVRTYPAYVTSDWDLGQAYLDFGETVHFEKGVSYRLMLPAGSVCTHREDIVNTDAVFDFIGGYAEPIECPSYHWCSLFDNRDGIVNEVRLFFRMPISLIPDKPILLTESGDDDSRSWEAMPSLSEENGEWVLTADFEGVRLKSGNAYSIVVPEGTVVTAEGDVAVNRTQSYAIDATGINALEKESTNKFSVYTTDGKLIQSKSISDLYT